MDLRQASSWEELISPRYSTCRCTTRPPATRRFSTTLHVRCSLPSFLRVLARRNILDLHYRQASRLNQKLGRGPRLRRGLNQGRIREVRLVLTEWKRTDKHRMTTQAVYQLCADAR